MSPTKPPCLFQEGMEQCFGANLGFLRTAYHDYGQFSAVLFNNGKLQYM